MTLFSKTCRAFMLVVRYGCITHCVFEYIGDIVVCSGPSMEPTLFSKNILLTEHITPRLQNLKKGDIVIAKSPSNPHQHICKRVLGLPNDIIKAQAHTGSFYTQVVPRGHIWLEGDNSSNSSDSRMYGPIPQGLVRSKAVCRIWPLTDLKMLSRL